MDRNDALVDEVLERDDGWCQVEGPGCTIVAVTVVRRPDPAAAFAIGDEAEDLVAACEACAGV